MQNDNLENNTPTDANNMLWAVLLIEKDYDAGFKDDDLSELMDMKYEHDEAFKKWCKKHYYAGDDDEMSNDLQWIGKVIKFFIQRGYLKNCPQLIANSKKHGMENDQKHIRRVRFSGKVLDLCRVYFPGVSFQKLVENAVENEIRRKMKKRLRIPF